MNHLLEIKDAVLRFQQAVEENRKRFKALEDSSPKHYALAEAFTSVSLKYLTANLLKVGPVIAMCRFDRANG